jgi:phosphoribosylaminoimidazole (AIR) synthetase
VTGLTSGTENLVLPLIGGKGDVADGSCREDRPDVPGQDVGFVDHGELLMNPFSSVDDLGICFAARIEVFQQDGTEDDR